MTASGASQKWRDYWNRDSVWARSEIWQTNAEIFFRKTKDILHLTSSSKVFEIGCGAGHLAALAAPYARFYVGIDPSGKMIELAQKRCERYSNVLLKQGSSQNFDFEKAGRFDLFLCVSVIQYFENLQAVLDLVKAVEKAASPGAVLILADLPQPRANERVMNDFLSSWVRSFQEGYFFQYLGIVFRLLFSDYRNFSKQHEILEIPVQELKKEIEGLGLKAEIIRDSVSIAVGRPSLKVSLP